MAVVTWYYPIEDAERQLKQDMGKIISRYNKLKKKMLKTSEINRIRKAKIDRIRNFLNSINANLANVSDDALLQYLSSGMTAGAEQAIAGMNELLENLAANASVLTDKNPLSVPRLEKLDDFFASLGALYQLLEQGRKNKMVSYDYNTLALELDKIAQALLNSPNLVMKETGNALGHIGAQGAVPYIVQNSIQSIIQQLVPSDKIASSRIKIVDTGKAKTSARKQTVTTDTLLMTIDPNTGDVKATLTISDKFNAKYKRTSKNTGAPIKLATRNVRNFIQDVKGSSLEGRGGSHIAAAYERAITNFLSYHTEHFPLTKKHHQRVDFTKKHKNDWKQLRQAIGAEMMHHEIYTGKGSFDYNGNHINDLIDISFYGGKLYLASDILNTINTRKQNNNFSLAQIPVSQTRQKFMTGKAAPNVLPKRFVIEAYRKGLGKNNNYKAGQKAGEKIVGLVLETATMSYSQKIIFS